MYRTFNKTKSQKMNTGKIWSSYEDDKLMEEIKNNTTLEQIAENHKRSTTSIKFRLKTIACKLYKNGMTIDKIIITLSNNYIKLDKKEIIDYITLNDIRYSSIESNKESDILQNEILQNEITNLKKSIEKMDQKEPKEKEAKEVCTNKMLHDEINDLKKRTKKIENILKDISQKQNKIIEFIDKISFFNFNNGSSSLINI